jgi:hypothetical protein
MSKEAMKLALEALKGYRREMNDGQPCDAEKALEKALAKQEQGEPNIQSYLEKNNLQPVAWMDADGNVSDNNDHRCFPIPLYTTTPQQRTWVGLTDEEVELVYAIIIKIRKKDIMPGEQKMFARTIEAKLKEKNT